MENRVELGIDRLLQQKAAYKQQRIGLACNVASLTQDGIHSRIALKEAGFHVVKLFAPEHGFDGQGVDGAFMAHQLDRETGIPIVSLYSEQLAPTAEDLADLDLMLIDLPDIGARFYTYLWTMTHVLESCAQQGVRVLLLDRPNPMAHALELAEGPVLDPHCSSFIGRYPIPVTHHCTFGELARYFKSRYFPNLQLEVLAMNNWSRTLNQGYTFFPTSPAIQKRETIYTYAGACLFEGLNIHEGRGTAHPFAQFGAPWIDAELLLQEVEKLQLDAEVIAVHYTPTISLYAGKLCHGLLVIPQHPQTFQSFRYFLQLIQLIAELFPNQLSERNYLTNVNPTGKQHLDLLFGIPNAFTQMRNNTIDTQSGMDQWQRDMQEFLLY